MSPNQKTAFAMAAIVATGLMSLAGIKLRNQMAEESTNRRIEQAIENRLEAILPSNVELSVSCDENQVAVNYGNEHTEEASTDEEHIIILDRNTPFKPATILITPGFSLVDLKTKPVVSKILRSWQEGHDPENGKLPPGYVDPDVITPEIMRACVTGQEQPATPATTPNVRSGSLLVYRS